MSDTGRRILWSAAMFALGIGAIELLKWTDRKPVDLKFDGTDWQVKWLPEKPGIAAARVEDNKGNPGWFVFTSAGIDGVDQPALALTAGSVYHMGRPNCPGEQLMTVWRNKQGALRIEVYCAPPEWDRTK